ncbi:hypothetical protein ACHAXR_011109 [Thalassiosira sp. AJA248-18]
MIVHPSLSRRRLVVSLLAIAGMAESFAPMTSLSRGATISSSPTTTSLSSPSFNNAFYETTTAASTVVSSGSITSSTTSLKASFLDEETTQKLIVLTFEKLIEAGVPAVFFIVTTLWFLSQMRGDRESRGGRGGGRGGGGGGGGMMGMMGGGGGRGGGRARRGGGRMMGGGGFDPDGGRPLGPVEELYDDIYDDLSGPEENNVPPFLKLFSGGPKGRGGMPGGGIDRPTSKLNIGIPKKQYLKVTKLNSKYDSFRYSMIKATKGKAVAAGELRAKGFEDALWRALGISGSDGTLGSLTTAEGTALLKLERDFLSIGAELIKEVADLTREITNAAVLEEMEELGYEAGVIDAEKNVTNVIDAEVTDSSTEEAAPSNDTATAEDSKKEKKKPKKIEKQADIMRAVKEVEAINTEILLLELDFIQSIVEILGPNRADTIRATVVGNMINGEAGMLLKTLKERPLATVLSSFNGGEDHIKGSRRKNLFVTRFPGDVSASQLNELREEVTGILGSAQPGDEALLVLQSGGGTVTGYGLAAAQLQRFKAKGMKLTVCVEQVAASGGYMMCCTADRIVASPFAVLGSIGVISEVPNAYERLKQEGIEFQTVTAGKYKRTVTPTKKITKEDLKKSTEDIQEIFNLFKGFVKSQRPQLDIEDVATGDTWFGEDALEKGLCDELATADDVLLEFVDNGFDLYEVVYDPAPEGVGGLLTGLPSGSSRAATADASGVSGWRGVFRSVVRGVVSDVKDEVMAELNSSMNDMNSVERRYMAKDDSADRIQIKD